MDRDSLFQTVLNLLQSTMIALIEPILQQTRDTVADLTGHNLSFRDQVRIRGIIMSEVLSDDVKSTIATLSDEELDTYRKLLEMQSNPAVQQLMVRLAPLQALIMTAVSRKVSELFEE